jgi:hypothetical protein
MLVDLNDGVGNVSTWKKSALFRLRIALGVARFNRGRFDQAKNWYSL